MDSQTADIEKASNPDEFWLRKARPVGFLCCLYAFFPFPYSFIIGPIGIILCLIGLAHPPRTLAILGLPFGFLGIISMTYSYGIWQRERCRANLDKIAEAEHRWALATPHDEDTIPKWDDLIGGGYLKKSPSCPSGGDYEIIYLNGSPRCSTSNDPKLPHTYPRPKR